MLRLDVLRLDVSGGEFMGLPSFGGEDLGAGAVEEGRGAATAEAVAAVGSFEVVAAQPGLQVAVDVAGGVVEPVAQGVAAVQVQAGALEGFDEPVEVGGCGRGVGRG